jgi:hypothetical protein
MKLLVKENVKGTEGKLYITNYKVRVILSQSYRSCT